MKTWQALAWALFLGWGGAAMAQSTSAPAAQAALLRPDTLRAEPFADAAAVMTVSPGDVVRVLERKGSWSQVEVAGKRGWVRALNLRSEGSTGVKREGVLALETGRQAQGGVTVPLAVRNVTIPGPAARVLADLFEARDRQRPVKLAARRGTEGLALEISSPRAGYAYVFMAPNAGGDLVCVFPNVAQPDNDLAAGKALSLPAGGWRVDPESAMRLVAVVSDTPLDLALEGKRAEGALFALSVGSDAHEAVATAIAGGVPYGAANATVAARR